MNINQVIPTDNLYKYFAIFGLVKFVLLLLFGSYSIYTFEHHSLYVDSLPFYNEAIDRKDKIDCRIIELSVGKTDKCQFDFLDGLSVDQEISSLTHMRKVAETDISRYERYRDIGMPVTRYSDFIDKYNLMHVYFGLLLFSLVEVYFGFTRWYLKVQRPINIETKLNIEHKEIAIDLAKQELLKIQLEITQLKEKNRSRFRK
ncbi:hypothetical protein AKG94_17795 [Vibrio harveyi]|uniref:hypothetical protein n=1 Tax=Vibrio TaxID=662 RepID=UPI0005F07318|nr:hypothetical protein [Vibrio harveyi]KNY42085.1 hypothetical protein AKG94_17795 [Vibrio harveyi]